MTKQPTLLPLDKMSVGQSGRVDHLRETCTPSRLNKLLSMGILPGVQLRLKRRSPSFVFELGFTQYAVDQQIAADIFVQVS